MTTENAIPEKRVLFFAPFGAYRVHHQLDAVLATALAVRDCAVCVVGCDGIYKSCDVLAWSKERAAEDCRNCAASGSQLFSTFNLPYIQLGSYLTSEDRRIATEWADKLDPARYASAAFHDIPIAKWVTSSVFSFFRIGYDYLDRPHIRALHKQYLINGLLTYFGMSKLVDQYKPTNMCVYNARFGPYRVAFEVGRRQGIPVIVHERGFADNTFTAYENHVSNDTQPIAECAKAWEGKPLNSDELARVKQYLTNRERGTDFGIASFYDFNTTYESAKHLLRIPPEAKVFGVFTSSEYEVAYLDNYKSIASQLEIIDKLIEIFRGRSEYLVVRHHPYIGGTVESPPDLSFMTRATKQAQTAPPNVRIIMPHERLSSYALIWNVAGAISFHSAMGIELEARGVATAAFKESPFQAGVSRVIEGTSIEALAALVDDLMAQTEHFDTARLRNNYRFIHSLISKLSIKFQSFGMKNLFEPDLRLTSIDQLLPGNDRTLDRLCDHVTKGTPVLDLPEVEATDASQGEEDDFFESELKAIRELREVVTTRSAEFGPKQSNPSVAVIHARASFIDNGLDWNSPWIHYSRHKNLRHYGVLLDDAPETGWSNIIAQLKRLDDELVVITNNRVQYDEAFISSAVSLLGEEANREMCGVFFGAWLLDEAGRVAHQIFTKRNPVANFGEVPPLFPEVTQPHMLLSFSVFRRQALLEFMEAVAAKREIEQAAETTFKFCGSSKMIKTNIAMLVVVPPASGSE